MREGLPSLTRSAVCCDADAEERENAGESSLWRAACSNPPQTRGRRSSQGKHTAGSRRSGRLIRVMSFSLCCVPN